MTDRFGTSRDSPASPRAAACPRCRGVLSAELLQGQRQVTCPHCQATIKLGQSSASAAKPTRPTGDSASDDVAAHHTLGNSQPSAETIDPAASARPPEKPHSRTPERLGRFLLHEVLGRGGFGVVYRAWDEVLDRPVALKLPLFGKQEQNKAERFLNEAKAAAQLRHPHIVGVYEAGQIDGQLYLAAEYIKGETLAQRIKRERPTLAESVRWVREMALALELAHRLGIVHRDMKPHNVMIDAQDRPRIMDFGLAKRLQQTSRLTQDGALLGTPAYMSPEQARGAIDQIGPASDQYSLAAVLYELLTAQKPFEGAPAIVVARAATESPPAPRTIDPTIPLDLSAVCQKAMSFEPQQRYPSAAAFAADLERWERGSAVIARPPGSYERIQRWMRKSPTVAVLTVAAFLLMFTAATVSGMAVYLVSQSNGELQRATERAERQAREVAEQARQAQAAIAQTEAATREAEQESGRAKQAEAENRRTLERLKQEITGRDSARKKLDEVAARNTKAQQDAQAAVKTEGQTTALLTSLQTAAEKEKFVSYTRQLREVYAAIQAREFSRARRLLDATDTAFRKWEWQLLEGLIARSSTQPLVRVHANIGGYIGCGVSEDGTLVGIAAPSRKLGYSEVQVLQFPLVGSPRLAMVLEVEERRKPLDQFVSFSEDGTTLVLGATQLRTLYLCPIATGGKKVFLGRQRTWKFPEEAPVPDFNAAVNLYNSTEVTAKNAESRLGSPIFKQTSADQFRRWSLSPEGHLELRADGEPEPVLAIALDLTVASEPLVFKRAITARSSSKVGPLVETATHWTASGRLIITATRSVTLVSQTQSATNPNSSPTESQRPGTEHLVIVIDAK